MILKVEYAGISYPAQSRAKGRACCWLRSERQAKDYTWPSRRACFVMAQEAAETDEDGVRVGGGCRWRGGGVAQRKWYLNMARCWGEEHAEINCINVRARRTK